LKSRMLPERLHPVVHGLPCSGKSAVADKVAEILRVKGMRVERLDGDIVRQDLTRDLGFSRRTATRTSAA